MPADRLALRARGRVVDLGTASPIDYAHETFPRKRQPPRTSMCCQIVDRRLRGARTIAAAGSVAARCGGWIDDGRSTNAIRTIATARSFAAGWVARRDTPKPEHAGVWDSSRCDPPRRFLHGVS